jgi:hypothetical protein
VHGGNGLGSRKRAASPSRAACTRWLLPLEVCAGVCQRDITTAARTGRLGNPVGHFEWGMGGIGDHISVPSAAATAGRLYWSRMEPPTLLSVTQGREPTDPSPVTRHAERRKLREARLAPSFLGQLFAKLGNPENVWVCGEKKRVPVHIWCLPDCKRKRPTTYQNCMRGGSCYLSPWRAEPESGLRFEWVDVFVLHVRCSRLSTSCYILVV